MAIFDTQFANIEPSYTEGNTLLHLAVKSNHKRLVKKLVMECDADTACKNGTITSQHPYGEKPKHLAPVASVLPHKLKEYIAKKVLQRFMKKYKIKKWPNKIKRLKN